MGEIKTDAIVLRHVDFGESHRMLTLLSPTLGKLSVGARGCRKRGARLTNATEVFCAGEYILYQKQDKYTLRGCTIKDAFYDLRCDYRPSCRGRALARHGRGRRHARSGAAAAIRAPAARPNIPQLLQAGRAPHSVNLLHALHARLRLRPRTPPLHSLRRTDRTAHASGPLRRRRMPRALLPQRPRTPPTHSGSPTRLLHTEICGS